MPWFCGSYLGSMVNRLPLQNPVLLLPDAIQRKEVTQMKPDYSHTYQSCIFSMKRESAPWRVASGCSNHARLFTGRHYELPNKTVCLACPAYVSETDR